MRIQHVTQPSKAGRTPSPRIVRKAPASRILSKHISWRLRHGQVQRALGLIGDTLKPLDAITRGASLAAVPAAKLAGVLRSLETYVCGQSDLIIDYATARHSNEPISTATTESTVPWLLHPRMGANQQLRWSGRREARI